MARGRKKKKKGWKILLGIIVLLVIGAWVYYFVSPPAVQDKLKKNIKVKSESSIKIVDINSTTRPYAVMIDNHDTARHAGLQDSYLNYEIIVEGGLTRIMALFKDQNTELIGPVRSSRHYFLDYAMENDAIYAHFGWSDRAKNDISSLGINNMNGITNASNAYWRDTSIAAPHNVYTSMENLEAQAKTLGYSTESEDWLLLDYSEKNVDLSTREDAMVAVNVDIVYSYYHTTGYYYDADNKVYLRSMNNVAHKDRVTGETYTAKNVIIEQVGNYSFDSEGRQDLENIGTGNGYYMTNGYAVPITWTKDSRSGKTKYAYLDGTELKVNDGNTWIQIQPTKGSTNIAAQ